MFTSIHFYCHYLSPSHPYLSPSLFIIALGYFLAILLSNNQWGLWIHQMNKNKNKKTDIIILLLKILSIISPHALEQNSNYQALYVLTWPSVPLHPHPMLFAPLSVLPQCWSCAFSTKPSLIASGLFHMLVPLPGKLSTSCLTLIHSLSGSSNNTSLRRPP